MDVLENACKNWQTKKNIFCSKKREKLGKLLLTTIYIHTYTVTNIPFKIYSQGAYWHFSNLVYIRIFIVSSSQSLIECTKTTLPHYIRRPNSQLFRDFIIYRPIASCHQFNYNLAVI
jgi:hypothetical protein